MQLGRRGVVCPLASRHRGPSDTGPGPLSGAGEGRWRGAGLEDWAAAFGGTPSILPGLSALGLGLSSTPVGGVAVLPG